MNNDCCRTTGVRSGLNLTAGRVAKSWMVGLVGIGLVLGACTSSDTEFPNLNAVSGAVTGGDATLVIDQVHTPEDNIAVGQHLVVSYTVTNMGPDEATTTSFDVDLPATGGVARGSVTAVTVNGGTCSNTASSVSCDLGTIAVNASATISVTITTTLQGLLGVNASTLAAESAGLATENFSVRVTAGQADVAVACTPAQAALPAARQCVTISDATPAAGEPLSLAVLVENNGPASATEVEFVLNFESLSALTINTVTADSGTCNTTAGGVRCSTPILTTSGSWAIVINVTPTAPQRIRAVGEVSSGLPDNVEANNKVALDVSVGDAEVDLALTVTDAPDPVAAEELVTFSVSIEN
ncbi:MAG: hypothetical protein ACI9MR_003848, partial [Myxococcota bacterium]